MTISSTATKSGPYDGNDVTTVFPYGFKIFASSDLRVVHTDSSGVETDLVESTHYSVSGVGDAGGGNVTYPVSGSPLPTGEKLTIISDIPYEQETDLSNQGGWFPEVHEEAFDKLCRLTQQLDELVSRAVLAPVSSATLPDDLYSELIATQAAVEAIQDAIELAHLGPKASAPTTLNDGTTPLGASHEGIRYWNTTSNNDWTWTGSVWQLTASSAATSANLVAISDVGGYYTGTDVEAALQEIGAGVGSSKTHRFWFNTTDALSDKYTTPWFKIQSRGGAGLIRMAWNTAAGTVISAHYRKTSDAGAWQNGIIASGVDLDLSLVGNDTYEILLKDTTNDWSANITISYHNNINAEVWLNWNE